MKEENINKKFLLGAKWATITEVASKIITPLTNVILARLISPEAFGVVATITMIMSFADMFTDAGFQKYLVQHQFRSEKEKFNNANVAFWTNICISLLLWILIIIFRHKLAVMVGNDGLGNVIAIACFQLLLTSFSSIQMALYRREFDFKTIFLVRVITFFVPFLITIPLALMGMSYWSLIIGSIVTQLLNAIVLTIKSKWKPKFFYSITILKEMISFSIWSLMEAILIWLTSWIDIFIISNSLNQYYLGVYRTSITMVNSLMALITASVVPVLFSALCRLQNNQDKFNKMFLDTQRLLAIFVIPLGVGIYIYRELITNVLLGSQWGDANDVIGIWALTSSIVIVLSNLNSEVYRAKGRPRLSILSQVLHLIVLIPACIISSKYGFKALVNTRALIRIEAILVGVFIMKYFVGFPVKRIFNNIKPIILSTIIMTIVAMSLNKISNNIIWSIISIVINIGVYFVTLSFMPSMKGDVNTIMTFINNINNKKCRDNDESISSEQIIRRG